MSRIEQALINHSEAIKILSGGVSALSETIRTRDKNTKILLSRIEKLEARVQVLEDERINWRQLASEALKSAQDNHN